MNKNQKSDNNIYGIDFQIVNEIIEIEQNANVLMYKFFEWNNPIKKSDYDFTIFTRELLEWLYY